MEWVLVITLVIGGQFANKPVATDIHSVDGFKSLESCLNAGNAWLTRIRVVNQNKHATLANAVCIKK